MKRHRISLVLVVIAGMTGGCATLQEGLVSDRKGTWIQGTWKEGITRRTFTFRSDGTFAGAGIIRDLEYHYSKDLPESVQIETAEFSSYSVSGTYEIKKHYEPRRGFTRQKLRRLMQKHGLEDYKRFYVLTLSCWDAEQEYVVAIPWFDREMAIVKAYDSRHPFRDALRFEYAGLAE